MEIEEKTSETVNSVESLELKLKQMRKAQEEFAKFSQKQVDEIFFKVAVAANQKRLDLAKMAYEETRMGVLEDKVIKNNFASEYIYNKYRDTKTCGIVEQSKEAGFAVVAEPVGVVAAVIPTTNPTSTVIFKVLLSLKTRNAVFISPHPRAKQSIFYTAKLLHDVAVEAGAPKDIIACISEPSLELTQKLMANADLILATGGPGLVKASYSSGVPALGVGAGNTPAYIDGSANLRMAVMSIIHSKTFDNGVICSSEQSCIVANEVYDEVKGLFKLFGCHFLNSDEIEKMRKTILIDGALNSKIVGQKPATIARLAGFEVDEKTKVLIGEVDSVEDDEPFAYEKLSPILAMYRASGFDDAVRRAKRLVMRGYGHTSSIYLNVDRCYDKLQKFQSEMKTCRVVVNMPSAQGAIGDIYNFKLTPSLTLGCGSWGGNSISDNVGVSNLLNYKKIVERRENMLWFKAPEKVYFKKGCLEFALRELKEELDKKRAFIVTGPYLYKHGYVDRVMRYLDEMGIVHSVFYDVPSDPDFDCTKKGAKQMESFQPDVIIAVGGGSPMDAAKVMWLMYEHPDVDFADLSMRFMDIRKRVYKFPKLGKKAYFIACPTSAGTGSEVTPFTVITDSKTKIKYPLADYELMPNMAIVDSDLMMNAPKSLTAASGIDALVHALEAYVSVMASSFTDGPALMALKLIFEFLPRAYDDGEHDVEAREKMASAATQAGMAFANAFLGVCHSMAHKLGAFHHLPHGIANALLITTVMRFNVVKNPQKMGTFPQYEYPKALERYCECAHYLGIEGNDDNETFEKLIEAIEQLKKKIGIKASIKDYDISEEEFLKTLDEMSECAFDDQCTGANPRYPLISEIKDMFKQAYYGNGSEN